MSDQATQPAGMKAITCSRVHRGEAHQAHTFMPPYQGGALYWCPGTHQIALEVSEPGWDRGSLDRHNALTPPDAERVARYCNAMGEKNNTIHGQRLARAAMAVADAERDEALAALERIQALLDRWMGGTGHLDTNKFVSVADIRAALQAKP